MSSYTISYEKSTENDVVENMPETQMKVEYDEINLSEKIPNRDGYKFLGWSTEEKSNEIAYLPNDVYSKNENITLYAIWEDIREEIDVTQYEFKNCNVIFDNTPKTILSNGQDSNIIDIHYSIEPIGESILIDGDAIKVGEYEITATYILKDEINYKFKDGINKRKALLKILKRPDINLEEYEIAIENEINYLKNVPTELLVSKLKEKVLGEHIQVFKDGILLDNNDYITTGCEIKVDNGEEEKTYNVIIKGDLFRDGKIDQKDLLMLARYIVEYEDSIKYMNKESLMASDVFEDGEFATNKDLLKIAQMLVE